MINRIRELRASLTARQQAGVIVLMVLIAALLYAALLQAALPARDRAQASVKALRAQSVQLTIQAAEYSRLRDAAAPGVAKADLRTVLQSQADTAGLSEALVKIDAQDADRVQVTFGSIAFGDWLDWIRTLQAQHARIDSCRIEALSAAGLVSVTAVVVRSRPQ